MKDLKISKELIKAVLEKETETLSKDFNFTINEDYIEFSDDGEMQFEYCIYKFAFKCKDWAYEKGYIIDERGTNLYILTSDGISDMYKDYGKPFCPNRVFEACEWILSEVYK